MTKSKKVVLISVALSASAFAGWGIFYVWDARLGPFSTGTPDEAFLGTTFGMSPQEVRRAVSRHGAQLLTYEDDRKSEPSPSIDALGAIPLFSDDRREDVSYYTSSIEMFDSKVEAEFRFWQQRLASVSVHFDPIAPRKADSVVSEIESRLRSIYEFSQREESQQVPGAYTLRFASRSATPSLWVNLAEHQRAIIVLTIVHPTTQLERKRQVKNRERTAFGAGK